jgi:hypothetical protein
MAQLTEMISASQAVEALNLAAAVTVHAEVSEGFAVSVAPDALD